MLERLVSTVYTYLNVGAYYKDALEIKNAINMASLDLYKHLRGSLAQYAPGRPLPSIVPEATNVSRDAISELYREYFLAGSGPLNRILTPLNIVSTDNRIIDIIESIEVSYSLNEFYPVNIVPDNQYLMMRNNPIIPPVNERPLGRMAGLFSYDVLPGKGILQARVRCLTLPNLIDFSIQDTNYSIPQITVIDDFDWTEDKFDNLVYGTISNLGFNLSNGVLVQSGEAMNQKNL
jgi:hypothetical protein